METDGASANSESASCGTLSDGDDVGPSADGTEKNDLEGENEAVKREAGDADSKEAILSG